MKKGVKPLPTPPSDDERKQTLDLIRQKLALPEMDNPENEHLRDGFQWADQILSGKQTTLSLPDELTNTQARAIAQLAIDYLAGECPQKLLVEIQPKADV